SYLNVDPCNFGRVNRSITSTDIKPTTTNTSPNKLLNTPKTEHIPAPKAAIPYPINTSELAC
ncbi:MAG: hypothetical protein ACTSQZ_07040, partial [Candidatus Thorarchaeota archaeon]